jgi:hypothetical protein
VAMATMVSSVRFVAVRLGVAMFPVISSLP